MIFVQNPGFFQNFPNFRFFLPKLSNSRFFQVKWQPCKYFLFRYGVLLVSKKIKFLIERFPARAYKPKNKTEADCKLKSSVKRDKLVIYRKRNTLNISNWLHLLLSWSCNPIGHPHFIVLSPLGWQMWLQPPLSDQHGCFSG